MLERKVQWAGIFVAFLGKILLCSAIFNWSWIYEGKRNKLSLAWVSDRFGRKIARIVAAILGALVVIYGIYFTLMV